MSYLSKLVEVCLHSALKGERLVNIGSCVHDTRYLIPYKEDNAFRMNLSHIENWRIKQLKIEAWEKKYILSRCWTSFVHLLQRRGFQPTNAFLTSNHIVDPQDVRIMGYLFRTLFTCSSMEAFRRYLDNASDACFYSALPNSVMHTRFAGRTRRQVLLTYVETHFTYNASIYSNEETVRVPSIF